MEGCIMAKKNKKINKQAAKLKEMRKNAPVTVPFAYTMGVKDFYRRLGIDNIFEHIDNFHNENKHKWYKRCYIPHDECQHIIYNLVQETAKKGMISYKAEDLANSINSIEGRHLPHSEMDVRIKEVIEQMQQEAAYLAPITASWRQHKQIFRFDLDFLETLTLDEEEIFEAEAQDVITRDELECLPFPSFFVEMPLDYNEKNEFCGFFFSYTTSELSEIDTFGNTLNFYFIGRDAQRAINNYDIYPNKSVFLLTNYSEMRYNLHDDDTTATLWENYLRDCTQTDFGDVTEEEKKERQRRFFLLLSRALQAITYLASEYADVTPNKVSKRTFQHTTEKKDIPAGALIWDVGSRHGSIKRKIAEEEQNRETQYIYREIDKTYHPASRKKPHSRAGHYQFYWYGKRDGSERRYKKRRWVEATYVNYKGKEIEELNKLPVTYHEVVSFDTEIKKSELIHN